VKEEHKQEEVCTQAKAKQSRLSFSPIFHPNGFNKTVKSRFGRERKFLLRDFSLSLSLYLNGYMNAHIRTSMYSLTLPSSTNTITTRFYFQRKHE
jgi:hypothetical protein